jgi:hypothetical protein
MGCDVFYHCRTSNQEQVERMVAMVGLYARDHDLPYRRIGLRNCALQETGRWNWPPDEVRERRTLELARKMIALGRGDARGKPLDAADVDRIVAERQAKLDYFASCQRSADLYGVAFPPLFPVDEEDDPELRSRGQLLFDFRANGILVNCAIGRGLDHAADATLPCSFLRVGGYWRSASDYLAFPRFLTLCRIRYLPALDFTSDHDEKSVVMCELMDRGTSPDTLRSMGDDEFYEEWLKGRNIFG